MAYYQYTVKYLCSELGEGDELASGIYRTAINIHNPYDFPQQPMCWKVVSPRPSRDPAGDPVGPAGPWQQLRPLPPDGGMEITCRLIRQFPLGPGIPPVGPTGFVVIRSPNELDVVAVYTVERPNQPAIALEIEAIAPRIIQTDREMCQP